MPDPPQMPSTEDIAPTSFDPMLGAIRIAKQTGIQLSDIPNPIMQLVGNAMTTVANQHEALHLSVMGMVKLRNFVQQGGLEALDAEIRKSLPPELRDNVELPDLQSMLPEEVVRK